MHSKIKLLGLLGIFCVLAVRNTPAQANASPKPACENAMTQAEINQCMSAAYKAADTELNSLFASLQGKSGDAITEKLRAAQRAWIKYRDADCEAEAELYAGGSVEPAVHAGCLERVTRARIAELHAIYDTR